MQHPTTPGVERDEHDEGGGVRHTARRWSAGRLRRGVLLALVLLLLPVPWQLQTDSGLGLVWRLNGRLLVEDQRLDPPGRWSWITAGRPALLGELAWERAARLIDPGATGGARDLRVGTAAHRPVHVTPRAAAVGLAAAGLAERLPDGELAPVDAVLGGHGPPYSWIRSLSMGSSHALMVGLVTYAAASGEDLAAGRHVAGTGRLAGDGTVGTISALRAKAVGARRAGVDVLLVPAAQRGQLDDLDLAPMQVVGVASLEEAIAQLRATR